MLLQLFQRVMALMSVALLVGGAYLLWSWWDLRQALDAGRLIYEDDIGWRLWGGLALLAVSLLGRTPALWLLARKGDDADRHRRLEGRVLETPTGARLHVESHGPPDAPALIFVHGWGLDAGVWREARLMLGERYQVIAYDLAGLGRSKGPADSRYSLDGFADDLMAVVRQAAPRKVILVGHSIGGMILQTFARRHAEVMGRQVLGLVLENTTHTDPTRTTILGKALHAMRPALEPLMRLDAVLAPLVWAMNWQSYLSGGTHVAMRFGGFGTRPTRAQLEQVSRAATRNHPAVQAKGNLAMMHWDATGELPAIGAPTLVFIGGRDLVTVPQAGERIAHDLRAARPEYVGLAGHLGPMELAETYNTAIAQFADELFTRGAAWADRRPDSGIGGEDQRPAGGPRPFPLDGARL
jgi:pimeloyl-ACP methyl ester carboxylesterase